MSEANSTTLSPSGKPAKPYPDFPLTPHPTRRWCKKIRGRIYYFEPIDNPDAGLAKYLAEKDALHAGCKPRPDVSAVSVKALCNAFLNHKQGLLEVGELTAHTWTK